MPIKAMGAEGYGTTFDIGKGIIWAVDHGANVINMCLGNYQPSSLLKEAIDYAYNKNVVLISAAGNENTIQPSYPAAYPEVLSVSAVDNTGRRASFVQITSTYFNQQYAALSGTSMASPHVAGLAGLLLSANPNLTNREVIDILRILPYVYWLHSLYMLRETEGEIPVGVDFLSIPVKYVLYLIHSNLGST
ncbi:S8 family serine peptidase [Sutcliffiella cohnii]